MKKNMWALGDRSISGTLDNVYAAGDLKISDADIKKLRVVGNVDVNNSYINLVRTAGDIHIVNSNFGDFKAIGNIDIKGTSKASKFVSTGNLKADYLECGVLRNCTKAVKKSFSTNKEIMELSGSFKAVTFENLYPLRMNCDFQFDNIISASFLQSRHMLECDSFYSFDELDIVGVNAEFIYIKPNKKIEIESIVGSHIVISNSFKVGKEFNTIPMTLSPKYYKKLIKSEKTIMSAVEIEGDKIDIEYVKAEHVSGVDVVIGDLCIIEKLEYKDSIKISEKAVVNEIMQL